MTEWQRILADAFAPAEPLPAVELALSSAEEAVHLSLSEGRLRLTGGPSRGEADLAVRLEDITLDQVLLGRVDTRRIFEQATVQANGHSGPALPAGECALPGGAHFDPIPGASMSIAITVTSTAFGEAGLLERWEDGVLVSSELLPVNRIGRVKADVRMFCPLPQLAAIRRREVTPLEAIGAGLGVSCDWPQLMCLMELIQHPAYLPVWADTESIEAQARWGSVFATSAYGDAALRALLEADDL